MSTRLIIYFMFLSLFLSLFPIISFPFYTYIVWNIVLAKYVLWEIKILSLKYTFYVSPKDLSIL